MKLNTISTAPKDGRFILLFGDSGYVTTPLRCEVCRWCPDYDRWKTYSNDAFTDSGGPPICWAELPWYDENTPLDQQPKR